MPSVRNLDRVNAKLAALPAGIRDALAKAIDQGANDIAGLSRRLVRVRTGALQRSIKAVKGSYKPEHPNVRGVQIRPGSGLSTAVVAGNKEAFYARFVEFGTNPHTNKGLFEGTRHPGSKPHPYFFPAYRALKRQVRSRITRSSREAIRRIAAS